MPCGFNILSGFKFLKERIPIHFNFEFDKLTKHGSLATGEPRGNPFLALAFNSTFHMASNVICSQ